MAVQRLIPVPEPVARCAAAALVERADAGGGTRAAVMVANALTTGYITPTELGELRRWHASHPLDGGILARLYGGGHARFWHGGAHPARTAAALNPTDTGAMVSLPVPPDIAGMVERPDGEAADDMHVTLFYFGKAADLDAGARDALERTLTEFTATYPAPHVQLTHVERFTPNEEGMEPVVLVDDGPAVYALREALQADLAATGPQYRNDHAFRTHMTVGYYLPGDGPVSGPLGTVEGDGGGYEWTPDAIELHWAGEVQRFPFAAEGDIGGGDSTTDVAMPDRSRTAAARSPLDARLAKMSAKVNAVDRRTLLALHSAATVALDEALRQAAVKVETRAKSRNATQRAALAAADGKLTPVVLAAVGIREDELLGKRFDTLGAYALALLAAAERKKLRAAAQALGIDPDDVEAEYGAEVDRRAQAASSTLVAAMVALAAGALAGNALGPGPVGEYAGPVPFSLVRQSFDISARGAPAPIVDHSGPGPSDISDLVSGLTEAGGSLVQNLLAQAGVGTVITSRWVHGDPERPFPSHEALDGVTWESGGDYPDVLYVSDEDSWLDREMYEPGDHPGCTCLIETDYTPAGDGLGDGLGAGAGAPVLVGASEGTPD